MSQETRAKTFSELHRKGDPVILYNIWDAGSARAVAKAGAKALATGSFPVAGAQGYKDGQSLPLDSLLAVVERIVATVDLPLSVDFEGAYAREPEAIRANVTRLIAAGAIGVNFEDQVIGGDGLYSIEEQATRIAAVRAAADAAGVPSFFINARTDLFLKDREAANHPGMIAEALERGRAYSAAGASGVFMPGLGTPDLIGQAVEALDVPLNIIMMPPVPETAELAALGVARISYGGIPWLKQMAELTEKAKAAING